MGRKPKPKTRRTGQGSIYQRKDGRWQGSITVGYNENGYPQRIQVTKASRDDAVKELNAIIVRLSLGIPPQDDARKVKDYLEHWLQETVKPHREPKTYQSYEQSVRLHIVPHIGHLTLRKLTAQHVQAMLNRLSSEGGLPPKTTPVKPKPDQAAEPQNPEPAEKKPLSPATVRNAKAVLRRALAVAVKQRLIANNPAIATETPKMVQAEPVYLAQEEVAALLKAAAAEDLGNLVTFALMTGLRLGEATGLTWEDVDLDNDAFRVRMQLQRVDGALVRKEAKSRSSRRTLSLAPSAKTTLQDQKARQLLWKAKQEKRREEKRQAELRRAERLARKQGTPLPDGSTAQRLNDSGVQPLNDSMPQRLHDSGAQPLSDSMPQRLNDSEAKPFNPAGYVFTMPDGHPLDPKTVHDALTRMVEVAGIKKPISFHKLRHTAATHMAASGVPLVVLKDVLGHSQISLTANTYSHAVPAAVKAATDALEKAYRLKEQGQ